MTIVLPDVICRACQACQDLDLCRDPRLQARDWRCGGCGTERDVGEVEAALVGLLAAGADGYQLQDLKCLKCGSVASSHLQQACDMCGGHLRATAAPAAAAARCAVFANVAEFQGMPVLKELATWQVEGRRGQLAAAAAAAAGPGS